MYLCFRSIDFTSSYDFGTVLTIRDFLFFILLFIKTFLRRGRPATIRYALWFTVTYITFFSLDEYKTKQSAFAIINLTLNIYCFYDNNNILLSFTLWHSCLYFIAAVRGNKNV